jgi:hypothetical protein
MPKVEIGVRPRVRRDATHHDEIDAMASENLQRFFDRGHEHACNSPRP